MDNTLCATPILVGTLE